MSGFQCGSRSKGLWTAQAGKMAGYSWGPPQTDLKTEASKDERLYPEHLDPPYTSRAKGGFDKNECW